MKKWKQLLMAAALVCGIGAAATVPAYTASAVDILSSGCKAQSSSTVCKNKGNSATSMVKIVVNTMLFVLGMVAVVMIVIGGIRYASSNGDPGSVNSAKNTILYSVVGLIVAILSFAIVNFVLQWF